MSAPEVTSYEFSMNLPPCQGNTEVEIYYMADEPIRSGTFSPGSTVARFRMPGDVDAEDCLIIVSQIGTGFKYAYKEGEFQPFNPMLHTAPRGSDEPDETDEDEFEELPEQPETDSIETMTEGDMEELDDILTRANTVDEYGDSESKI